MRDRIFREWPMACIIALGAAIQLFLISRPIGTLIASILSDDTFFYFKIAHNVVQGLGSTFDGIHATNGYHPLWMLILLPIFKFFASPFPNIEPIYIALLVQVVMNALTALIVSRILSRFTEDAWVRMLGMIVWVLNPYFLYEMVNGLETSLALFLLSLFFLLVLRIEEEKNVGGLYFAGVVAGLMILARLDMAFYFLAFLAWIFMREGIEGWKNALKAVIPAIILVGAWLIWNIINFHMLLTAASQAEAMVGHVLVYQDNGSGWFQFFKAIIYMTQYELNAFFVRTGMLALGAAFIGAYFMLLARSSVALPRRMQEMSVLVALFGGFLMLFIANASIRWVGRTWYFVSFELFLSIIVVVVCDRLIPYLTYKRASVAALMSLVLFSFYVDWSKHLRGVNNAMATEPQLLSATLWMNDHLPLNALIGTFTPGVEGYFSKAHVVDLDGLINNSAYEALRQRQLWQYIVDEHITYIAESGDHFAYRYKSFIGIDDPHAYLQQIRTPDTFSVDVYQVQF